MPIVVSLATGLLAGMVATLLLVPAGYAIAEELRLGVRGKKSEVMEKRKLCDRTKLFDLFNRHVVFR